MRRVGQPVDGAAEDDVADRAASDGCERAHDRAAEEVHLARACCDGARHRRHRSAQVEGRIKHELRDVGAGRAAAQREKWQRVGRHAAARCTPPAEALQQRAHTPDRGRERDACRNKSTILALHGRMPSSHPSLGFSVFFLSFFIPMMCSCASPISPLFGDDNCSIYL